MKKLWKRNAVALAVLVLVCCAIYLNGRYAQNVDRQQKTLGQSTLVSAQQQEDEGGTEEPTAAQGAQSVSSDYFAAARLTRQQARDSALSLLQEAQKVEGADEATAAETAASIQTLAACTLAEAQIENMVTAKGYADCVAFLGEESISVVVAANEDGLQTEDIAKITDIVMAETGLRAENIRILEAG